MPLKEILKNGVIFSLEEILNKISQPILGFLDIIDCASKIVEELKRNSFVVGNSDPKNLSEEEWSSAALYHFYTDKPYQAIYIIKSLYKHIQEYEKMTKTRVHKGTPLVWLYEFYKSIGYNSVAKKYLMLTLIEDSISDSGRINESGGVYFRLSWFHGISDQEIENYFLQAFGYKNDYDKMGYFPEYVLQLIESNWKVDIPTDQEYNYFDSNKEYIAALRDKLGSGTGKEMEMLSEYLLSCIPGIKTTRRAKTKSTDYDVFCSIEGNLYDFRNEIGRYFICECKDWNKPANFSTIAKFSRILDSAKCKGGIIFSKNGFTGGGKTKDAEREILKLFHHRGVVIIVIDAIDVDKIQAGQNFIAMLKEKYEKIRLDLIEKK